ncbi:hypothetical protein FOL47_004503 [Perkinsus chesapeaki]|uniref:Cyclic nucleotide-binding domain-containing protein n=1 Tax=Perkinsus chesapeaki TaxID=330153 RepID=A0A7J6M3C9_PERCH|nr:hypothetical protein FOL47_004503 [Perkinsus chesapeaki]
MNPTTGFEEEQSANEECKKLNTKLDGIVEQLMTFNIGMAQAMNNEINALKSCMHDELILLREGLRKDIRIIIGEELGKDDKTSNDNKISNVLETLPTIIDNVNNNIKDKKSIISRKSGINNSTSQITIKKEGLALLLDTLGVSATIIPSHDGIDDNRNNNRRGKFGRSATRTFTSNGMTALNSNHNNGNISNKWRQVLNKIDNDKNNNKRAAKSGSDVVGGGGIKKSDSKTLLKTALSSNELNDGGPSNIDDITNNDNNDTHSVLETLLFLPDKGYAFVVGAISRVMASYDEHESYHRTKMKQYTQFMMSHSIKDELQMKVRRYVDHKFDKDLTKSVHYAPMDIVYYKGDAGDSTYWISSGKIREVGRDDLTKIDIKFRSRTSRTSITGIPTLATPTASEHTINSNQDGLGSNDHPTIEVAAAASSNNRTATSRINEARSTIVNLINIPVVRGGNRKGDIMALASSDYNTNNDNNNNAGGVNNNSSILRSLTGDDAAKPLAGSMIGIPGVTLLYGMPHYPSDIVYSDRDVRSTKEYLIHVASYHKANSAVKVLLEREADVNAELQDGKTALHIAVYNEDKELVALLAKQGANVQCADKKGITPRDVARLRQFKKVELLLDAMDIHTKARDGDLEGVRDALAEGCDASWIHPKTGTTPLYNAVDKGHYDVAELLLSTNADPDLAPDDGFPPLYSAANRGAADITELLLSHNADPNRCLSTGMSPLMVAIRKKHWKVAVMLLEEGADVNQADGKGITPLMMALSSLTSTLLEAKANPLVKTSSDASQYALAYAHERGGANKEAIIKAVKEYLPKDILIQLFGEQIELEEVRKVEKGSEGEGDPSTTVTDNKGKKGPRKERKRASIMVKATDVDKINKEEVNTIAEKVKKSSPKDSPKNSDGEKALRKHGKSLTGTLKRGTSLIGALLSPRIIKSETIPEDHQQQQQQQQGANVTTFTFGKEDIKEDKIKGNDLNGIKDNKEEQKKERRKKKDLNEKVKNNKEKNEDKMERIEVKITPPNMINDNESSSESHTNNNLGIPRFGGVKFGKRVG